jgi:hypothetical protein
MLDTYRIVAVKANVFSTAAKNSQYCVEVIYFKAHLTPTLCENFTFHAKFQTLYDYLRKVKNYAKTAKLCEKSQNRIIHGVLSMANRDRSTAEGYSRKVISYTS